MRTFKDLTTKDLLDEIKLETPEVLCHPMPFTIFCSIVPQPGKEMALKNEYKPSGQQEGLYSQIGDELKRNSVIRDAAAVKMEQNTFIGMRYEHEEASLKFHLNLNNIGDLDKNIVLGLIKFLIDEAENEDNNLSYHFKTVQPQGPQRFERFQNTDQLTVYFDKYSSTADVVRLAQKIENYLKEQEVPENSKKLGPKESFGFNSFVSARFDTNKLLGEYDVYKFFDLELGKFFERYKEDDTLNKKLENLPLCALECVFNILITSPNITCLKTKESGLSEEDSKLVQAEFDKMAKDPMKYIKKITERVGQELSRKYEKAHENTFEVMKGAHEITPDFSQASSEDAVTNLLLEKQKQLLACIVRFAYNKGATPFFFQFETASVGYVNETELSVEKIASPK